MTTVELIKKIAAGERNFALPMTLVLADGQRIECLQVLRLLPEKRLVLRVTIGEEVFILKLFSAAGGRAAKRERTALEQLAATDIPHAKLLKQQVFADGSAVHIYQFIDNARSPSFADHDLIKAVSALLCDILQAGWIQTDPHPDNFLCNDQGVWLIDTGSLQQLPSKQQKNYVAALAQWVAQFPLWQQSQLAETLAAQWNDLHNLPASAQQITATELVDVGKKFWLKRQKAYLKKIDRSCSEIDTGKNHNSNWKLRREFDGVELRAFLNDPEVEVSKGRVVKSGGATHIVRLNLDGRDVIIKRYNYRGIWQGIKSFAGLGRALQNWRAAHLLRFCHIDTPPPVAMLQVRDGWRVTGYILNCAVSGVEYLHAFDQRESTDTEICLPLILLQRLRQCAIEHGDLKAKNLLLDKEKLWLIDLDSLRSSHLSWSWRKEKDLQRFLHNWSARPDMLQRFTVAISSGACISSEVNKNA
jgi:tRNA A-37 threonylcarbamoyl transferase component Bud32